MRTLCVVYACWLRQSITLGSTCTPIAERWYTLCTLLSSCDEPKHSRKIPVMSYNNEKKIAIQAVQLACRLAHHVFQTTQRSDPNNVLLKDDYSPVTGSTPVLSLSTLPINILSQSLTLALKRSLMLC